MSALPSEFVPGFIGSAKEFPFLREFERNHHLMIKAYDFLEASDFLHELTEVSDKGNVQRNGWHVFPIYANRMLPAYVEWMSNRIGFDVSKIVAVLRSNLSETYSFLDEVIDKYGIINLTFSRIRPKTTIKLHINQDPFQYRAHIGIRLPKKDCFFKVNDTVTRWKMDRYFVFDTTQPHMAWNLSDEERVVLHLDFLREPREEMARQHHEAIMRKMEVTPMGFEGGYMEMDDRTLLRFNHLVQVVETA